MFSKWPRSCSREPWNKGRIVGQKRPLKPKEVWTIHVRLQLEERKRDLAMFNLAIDSKLRGCCDLFRRVFESVLRRCIEERLVGGEGFAAMRA